MNENNKIRSLFDKLRPIIINKLLNPDDIYVRSGGTQLIITLNAEKAESVTTKEVFTAIPSDYPNIWYVCPDEPIDATWETWETRLIIGLKTDDMRNYRLTINLSCYGSEDVVSYGQDVSKGTIAQIIQFVKTTQFPESAYSVLNACFETAARKIEESEMYHMESRLFANTDIADYDSVMKFVHSLKNKKVMRSKGLGMELFTYNRVVSLINRASKSVNVLVGRDGKAQFCRLDDFPDELLNTIRRENRNWDLGVYELSVGKFDGQGEALLTWIISPYYYCPADEDGYGEEEELEVAVTCHINSDGQLTDTPVWKPYTGPRR